MTGRKLKVWNGAVICKDGQQRAANVCAYSQRDVLAVLAEHGIRTSFYELRGWWVDCWGDSMEGIERVRGLWLEEKRGVRRLAEGELA
jgi:hypothetical protein